MVRATNDHRLLRNAVPMSQPPAMRIPLPIVDAGWMSAAHTCKNGEQAEKHATFPSFTCSNRDVNASHIDSKSNRLRRQTSVCNAKCHRAVHER